MNFLYANVFIEAAHYASIIPLSNEPTFFAMLAFAKSGFGNYSLYLALVFAIFGAMLGMTFNFILGYMFKKLYFQKKLYKHLSESQYAKSSKVFSKYGFLLLLIAWVPIVNFSVFAAGFLGMRAKITLPIVLAGELLRYGLITNF